MARACIALSLAALLLCGVAVGFVASRREQRPRLGRAAQRQQRQREQQEEPEQQQEEQQQEEQQQDEQQAALLQPSDSAGSGGPAGAALRGRRPCTEECYLWATCNEELGRCDCPKHRTGQDCSRNASASQMRYYVLPAHQEAIAPLSCLNGCNGRGACVHGACVCNRGHFGSDCSASIGPAGAPVLLAGSGYKPRQRGPRIYVYDIPHKYSSWFHPRKLDRGAHWFLWQRMLGAGVLVADGEEADWYFIPVKLRTTSDGDKLLQAVKYVRQHWPWYDRHHGSRHFVLHTGDTGRGEVARAVRAGSGNLTWLHHWGLTHDFPYSNWLAAHRPGKDIVVPIIFTGHQGQSLLPVTSLHPRAPALRRNGTLLFAGRICGDGSAPDPHKPWPHCRTEKSKGYSQGVRQMVHFHHHNRTGYRITTRSKTYGMDILSYKWCLAPSGGGHGHRQALAALMGCLPVVVSDAVMQPFEPEMDWSAFSVRVAQADIPAMHLALAAVGEQAYDRLQAAVRCAAQHLVYSSLGGAIMQEDGRYDAFETILEVLRMQQLHPGLDPKLYAATDARFRAFMACGSADMAAYGEAVRQEAARRYPQPLAEEAYGANYTWDELYDDNMQAALRLAAPGVEAGGWSGVEAKAKAAAGRGGLKLCSASKWDPEAERCSQLHDADKRARWAKEPTSHGSTAACLGSLDLSTCPRPWQ